MKLCLTLSLTLLIAATLLGCNKSPVKLPSQFDPKTYELQALDLPAGSKIVKFDDPNSNYTVVFFDNAKKWDDITAHFAPQLAASGYTVAPKQALAPNWESAQAYVKDVHRIQLAKQGAPKEGQPVNPAIPAADYVLMFMTFPKEMVAGLVGDGDKQGAIVEIELRKTASEIATAQQSYFKANGTYGSLAELTAAKDGTQPLLPANYKSGAPRPNIKVEIEASQASYTARVIGGQLGFTVDQTGEIKAFANK